MLINAVIQARMSSNRLPGKSLRPILGKPMLQYLLDRIQHCDQIDNIIIATSEDVTDDPIADYCIKNDLLMHRGSLRDVAGRFKSALDRYPADGFVRVNGDSPLLDGKLVDKGISMFKEYVPDLVTNIFPRTFPKGQSVEVINSAAFAKVYELMTAEEEFEHVTKYFYNHPNDFVIKSFTNPVDYSQIQLSVDTVGDMNMVTGIIAAMDKSHWIYGFEEILEIRQSLIEDGYETS
ncbi:MAG: cytidylyltransferase domain-containing protein [Acidobacteriota bacterium]